jgi:hypothetical protein
VCKGRYEMPAVHVSLVLRERQAPERVHQEREMMIPLNLANCVHKAALMIETCYKQGEFRR